MRALLVWVHRHRAHNLGGCASMASMQRCLCKMPGAARARSVGCAVECALDGSGLDIEAGSCWGICSFVAAVPGLTSWRNGRNVVVEDRSGRCAQQVPSDTRRMLRSDE